MQDAVPLNETELLSAARNDLLISPGPVSLNKKLYQKIENELSRAVPQRHGSSNVFSGKEAYDIGMRIDKASKELNNGGMRYQEFQRQRKQKVEMEALLRQQEIAYLAQQVNARENNFKQTAEEISRIANKRFENRLLQK
ncbi:MAG: hypothetical protein WAX69_14845 [Victivallales bacterium]